MIVTHPNRDKPVVQATRATVVLLLLVTAALILIVTVGGWNVLESAVPIQIVYIIVYLTLAFFAARWNRGVLPVAAALAVLLGIFALVAGPGWFDRDKSGFAQPDPERRAARRAHAADRPRADAARRVCHARLPPGLERRARAARPSGRRRHPDAGAPSLAPSSRPDGAAGLAFGPLHWTLACGGGGTVDAGPSKGPVRKGVWVRIPPAAPFEPR